MPTLTVTHEAPLELIRQHPSLAAELVRATLSIRLGRADFDKQYSWPAYVTNVRRAAKCPAPSWSSSARTPPRARNAARSWPPAILASTCGQ
jgi:hypothetical protein